MDERKSMNRICGILLLTLMIGVLTGCKPTAYSGQEEQAMIDSASALMEDYLREHYPSAVLLRDPKAEHTLDDDDRIALSGIVDAEYELPNGKLILTADTVTGEVSEEFFAYATIADTISQDGSDPGNDAQPQEEIAENGAYTTRDDVALYLHTYGHLPANFITKNEARALGWEGGGLEAYAPGKCIGGDYFGNYEGLLPDGNYHECDIDTLGSRSRGAKRLIYDDQGHIYYTEDHYESFVQLY